MANNNKLLTEVTKLLEAKNISVSISLSCSQSAPPSDWGDHPYGYKYDIILFNRKSRASYFCDFWDSARNKEQWVEIDLLSVLSSLVLSAEIPKDFKDYVSDYECSGYCDTCARKRHLKFLKIARSIKRVFGSSFENFQTLLQNY